MAPVPFQFRTGEAEYYVFELDAGGYPLGAAESLKLLAAELQNKEKKYTDVIVLAHGWNTYKMHDGSIYVANAVFKEMQDRVIQGRKPLFVQIVWPSAITDVFSSPSEGEEKKKFHELMQELRKSLGFNSASLSSSSHANKKVHETLNEVENEVSIFLDQHGQESCKKYKQLPEQIKNSLAKLANQLSHDGARPENNIACIHDENIATEVTAKFVEDKYKKMRKTKSEPTQSFLARLFGPAWSAGKAVLFAIYDLIFGTFIRRASIVGCRGVHLVLSSLMKVAESEVRFHLCGHSLGAHVVLSAAIGGSPGSTLTRKIHSVLLLQGACLSNIIGKKGLYRPLATVLKPVAGPILNTVYSEDFALKSIAMFLPRAVGRFGFEKTWPMRRRKLVIKKMKPNEIQRAKFRKSTVYNLSAKAIVSDHVDISDREIYDLFWQATTIQMNEKDFKVKETSSLPDGYWEDINVRNRRFQGLCGRS